MNKVKNVAMLTPEKMTTPRFMRLTAPGPVAMISGIEPITVENAVIEGARIRFRPVVMTAFSTVMGSIPLILASGPGAASRMHLGVVIFSGVSIATFFTLFIVPACYDMFARRTGSPNAVARRLQNIRESLAG